ncbi:helix-turn-helix transcriptional regulator [Thermomonospora umbrina]|uniref:Helix-turn-helix protein n=1 Tax=Thermomonospora umbrina TaxID=111806 RepID=A0A3D9SY26_9ACTN|nr:helix-turn-helix transcriptional regulator [Thermomonospora umbrina]REE97464.1 helix-turn-helix protein [Thermomonospora umbrina]
MPQTSNAPAPGTPFAGRLRFYRERSGKSRAVLGGLVGRSAEWVKGLEAGRLGQPGLPMLIRLADVLDVPDLAALTGEQRLSKATYTKHAHESLGAVRSALTSYTLPGDGAEPPSPTALAVRVAQAWHLWHGARLQRTALATLLPGLITDARAAVRLLDGAERRSALTQLAQIYHLTQLYLAFQPVPELVYLASDRAMSAAQDADDPHAIAAAAWYLNHVHRDAGEAVEARVQLAHDTAAMLRPETSREDLALHGLMHLAIALSHARLGKSGDAWRHHDEAARAAQGLGGHVHPWLMFGTGMVEHYTVTLHADTFQAARAIQAAGRIDPESVPSATRQSRYMAEVARAHHLRKDEVATVHLLKRAREASPDTLAYSLFARSAVSEMLTTGGPMVRDEVQDLALSLQLIA